MAYDHRGGAGKRGGVHARQEKPSPKPKDPNIGTKRAIIFFFLLAAIAMGAFYAATLKYPMMQ